MQYDRHTRNLMVPVIRDNKLFFISQMNEVYESTAEDTLIHEERPDGIIPIEFFKSRIKNMLLDAVNPLMNGYCPTCNKVQVIAWIDIAGKIIKACETCESLW